MHMRPNRLGRHANALALAGLLVLVAAPAVRAEAYLGKVCLTSTVTERETGPVTPEVRILQYEVTNLAGNIYVIAGKVSSEAQPFVATGFGMVIGNELYMNLATTQTHTDAWVDTGINQTRLNLTTLSGTFYEVGHDHNRSTRVYDSRFSAGTVTRTSCQ